MKPDSSASATPPSLIMTALSPVSTIGAVNSGLDRPEVVIVDSNGKLGTVALPLAVRSEAKDPAHEPKDVPESEKQAKLRSQS